MNIQLKKATIKDASFIYKLRLDKESQKFSISKKNFSLADHKAWLSSYLKYKKNKFYIITKKTGKSVQIGYVRFDYLDFYFKVSINISKKYRDKNLSKLILKTAENKINKPNLLIAEVIQNNTKSCKLFESSEYIQVSKQKGVVQFAKINTDLSKEIIRSLKMIDEIEKVRKFNNINWMDILRIAFTKSPRLTSEVFKKISSQDQKINLLSKKL